MSLRKSAFLMKLVALVFGIYALLWATAPFPNINLPARFILDVSDWPVDNLSVPLDRNTQWLVSIASGLLAALAVLLAFVVAPAIKRGDKNTVRATIYALIVWYVVDGIGSISAGVVSNVFFNTIYLGLALVPLVFITISKDKST